MNELINQFLLGGVVACCMIVGLLFLRFHTRSHDRLLMVFAIAFWVLGLNWLALAFSHHDELRTALYLVRSLAYLLILYGIFDKNRSSGRR